MKIILIFHESPNDALYLHLLSFKNTFLRISYIKMRFLIIPRLLEIRINRDQLGLNCLFIYDLKVLSPQRD